MKKILAALMILMCTTIAGAGSKTYVTGKLVDVSRNTSTVPVLINAQILSVENEEYVLSVQVGDLVYTGRYDVKLYKPDGFVVNDPVEVRFDGDKMYVRRLDKKDKELKMKIFKKTRIEPKP